MSLSPGSERGLNFYKMSEPIVNRTERPAPWLAKLSGEQRAAVTHGEGPMLVTAGPGSGKTLVLTSRVLYLIRERQVPPGRILVITFTRDAAQSMGRRFYALLGQDHPPGAGAPVFATFHSFFYQILQSHEKYSHATIISDAQKRKLLLAALEGRQEDAAKVLSCISLYKNTLSWDEPLRRAGDELAERLPDIFARYEREKAGRRALDLDDLLYVCRRLLWEDSELLTRWQRRFSYVLLDEFQDTSPLQYEIIRRLVTEPRNLFAVGDDDQSIYGFRGADAQILQSFLTDYPEAGRVSLGVNYRCHESIVEASRRVVEENRLRLPKTLSAGRPSQGERRVCVKGFSDQQDEFAWAAGVLGEAGQEALPGYAVLFRTNGMLQMFAGELMRRRIPFWIKDQSTSLYQHFAVKDVMDYLRAAAGCRDRGLFLRIFNRPRIHVGRECLTEPLVDFGELKEFYRRPGYRDDRAVSDLERFERKLKMLGGMPLDLGVVFIKNAFGYGGYLEKCAQGSRELLDEWLGLLEWLAGEAGRFQSLEQWEDHQRRYEEKLEREKREKNRDGGRRKEGAALMTIHGAKGLEYDHVLILGVNEGNIPKYRREEEIGPQALEEERRIFYVGMTRARESLTLLYLEGGANGKGAPSRFLEQVRENSKK